MLKTIDAIYENGVLKPVGALDLKEHERVKIVLEQAGGVARASSGMLKGLDTRTIDEIALSPDFLAEEA